MLKPEDGAQVSASSATVGCRPIEISCGVHRDACHWECSIRSAGEVVEYRECLSLRLCCAERQYKRDQRQSRDDKQSSKAMHRMLLARPGEMVAGASVGAE